MNEAETRPDPDVLLKRVTAEETREARTPLKLFFGFAPGVGKTYAMLESAHRLRAEGIDVVVGVAMTHGREETGALLAGLELLPAKRVLHRGKTIEEFDLDAALARKPQVLLLDELAHTNAPGVRHRKRWQDVLELLDAKIAVHTTLNVQHVESLNDVVAQITHVQVRETVPDALLERAGEIELVDVSPEELLARLRDGKVYLGEQAERAANSFFQRGNLLALRELALRRTAERVNRDVLEFREEHGVSSTWPTSDKIMVCVGPAPGSARLVRAARRMAAGLRAPWVAVYVETPGESWRSEQDRQRLEQHLQLAESLGASVVRLSGQKTSEPILEYARRNNVARIIVGKPTRHGLRELWRPSLVGELVKHSAEIDLHVISGDAGPETIEASKSKPTPARIPWAKYAWAAAVVAPATALGALAFALAVPDVEMLFLLAVMISAIAFGRGPSVLTAALSVAAYDFFFVSPRYTFAVGDGGYLLSFMMMFAVSLVLSTLALRIKAQQREAVFREERTSALYALSRSLGATAEVAEVARVTAEHARNALAHPVVLLMKDADDYLVPVAAAPADTVLDAGELGVAGWVYEHARPAGFGTDTLPGSRALFVPVQSAATATGVLAVLLDQPLTADHKSFVEALARQAAFALERAQLAVEARQAALRARTEELRSTLLSTVSHDLRTPIAAITGAGTALRDQALAPESRAEMIDTICEEADRLERVVANLLDMTRLDGGAIDLKRDWVPIEEVIGSATTRLKGQLSRRTVSVELPDDLPMIFVDPVLMQQLFVNLLENAVKYTPADSPLELAAKQEAGQIILEVRDRGPGIPRGDEERIFERFYRATPKSTPGVGLGLAISRAIARVHGGALVAENRAGGGAIFRLSLPLAEVPAR